MQSKRVQESREALQHCRVASPVRSANARFHLIRNTHLHEAQDAHRAGKPHYEDEDQYGLAKQAFEPQRARERHVPKYLR